MAKNVTLGIFSIMALLSRTIPKIKLYSIYNAVPQGYSEWGSENKKTGDGQKTIKPGKSDEDIDKPQRKQLLLVHGIPQIQGDL